MNDYIIVNTDNYLKHHGILGQKWGIRRYQNADGTLTEAGKRRQKYDMDIDEYSKTLRKEIKSIPLDKTARDPEAYRRWEIEKKLYKERKDLNKEANSRGGRAALLSSLVSGIVGTAGTAMLGAGLSAIPLGVFMAAGGASAGYLGKLWFETGKIASKDELIDKYLWKYTDVH